MRRGDLIMSLEFDVRSIEDLERQERREELDTMREDRNRGYHPIGECSARILQDPDLDIGV